MKRRHFFYLLGTLLFFSATSSFKKAKSLGVSETRFAQLTGGINLSHWLAQTDLTPENFQTSVTSQDIKQIREMGFRHVRLPLDPDVLLNDKHPEKLNLEHLKYLDRSLEMILAENLAVILEIHPTSQFKQRLYKDVNFVTKFAQFWQTLAAHVSKLNPEMVFLEVLNEPDPPNPQTWYRIQEKLLLAMRIGAPKHTLIASANQRVGDNWDTLKALPLLTPVQDSNVVYNFHFYQPKHFTHQGANWGWSVLRHFANVPYPSSPEAVAPLLPKIRDETARKFLYGYGQQNWNAKKIEEKISHAVSWAKNHGVRLTCNEFGVYRKVAPVQDRLNWLRDVRSILEKHQIGWAMWDYKGGFGVMIKRNGKYVPDQDMIEALFG